MNKRQPIKAGDVCVIVAEDHGCECNIGAMVTVTEATSYHGRTEVKAWRFKDASRLIKLVCDDDPEDVEWVTHSDDGGCDGVIADKHMVPIQPDVDLLLDEAIEELLRVGDTMKELTK